MAQLSEASQYLFDYDHARYDLQNEVAKECRRCPVLIGGGIGSLATKASRVASNEITRQEAVEELNAFTENCRGPLTTNENDTDSICTQAGNF